MVFEHLCELEESPMNINTATFEDLCGIPGLSPEQISDILQFRDRYGEFQTVEELAMVESIDFAQRVFISHFVVAKSVGTSPWYEKGNLKRLLSNGHGTVMGNISIPFYKRMGDEDGYLGGNYKYGVKLTGSFAEYIKYGVIGSQDAGEPFFKHGNNLGMDHYSFYLSVNKWGRVKNLTVGRFRVHFGLGLIQNTNFGFGKQTMLSAMGRVGNIVTGHSSRSDNYFQGVASTIDVGRTGGKNHWEVTAFYSYRKSDATLNKDGTISSLLNNGYHRTETEMAKKGNTSAVATGAHLGWRRDGWYAGVSGVYDWLDRDLAPRYDTDGYRYRKYNARGNSMWNASVDYGYNSSRLSVSGETATGTCGALATLNMVQMKASSELMLMAVQRFYSYKYYALYSNAFSEGGHVQNESGVYVGAQWHLLPHWTLDAYADVAYFPWMRYLVNGSSYAVDNSVAMSYSRSKWKVTGRYRLKIKERNNTDKSGLAERYEHRGRVSVVREGDRLSWRSQMDMSYLNFLGKDSFGWMVSQNVRWQVTKTTDCSAMIAYFHTSDYDTRLYAYERSMLQTFSMPSFYGHGMRMSAVGRWDVSRRFMLMCKIGCTKYFDRDVIGTGLRQIDGSYQVDFDLQFRWRF